MLARRRLGWMCRVWIFNRSTSCHEVERAREMSEKDDYWFDLGYEKGKASRDTEIESLRQKLALQQQHLDTTIDVLKQTRTELADNQKQVTLLRDVLDDKQWAKDGDVHAHNKRVKEALASTADLDDLILCHATPDSYRYKHHDSFGVGFFWSHRPTHQGADALESVPLYRAWKSK